MSLFHPRHQRWSDHFRLRGTIIEPLTVEGKVTVRLLRLNLDKRIVERQLLAAVNRYPKRYGWMGLGFDLQLPSYQLTHLPNS